MSTTTETKTTPEQPHAPELTVLTRVASIPMISSSLFLINNKLSTNSYTKASYCTAKGLSTSAYNLTEPIQVKLAPLIIRADGLANMAINVVENLYPYPFRAQPEEVATYVRERTECTTNYVHERVSTVNKAIGEKVKTPALHVAQDIDQRFAPLVDYFEVAVSRLNHSEAGPSTPPDAQYQYQRALALSKTLGGSLTVYTTEQVKHIQAQSVLAQKASQTAQSITSTAASSVASAHAHILNLSDNMLAELHKLQDSTYSFANSLQSQVPHLQEQLHQSYTELSAALSTTAADLTVIVKNKDLPVQEKVGRVGKEVRERVQPLLETIKKRISEILARTKEEAQPATTTGGTNGHTAP